jgi:hypothetical protein
LTFLPLPASAQVGYWIKTNPDKSKAYLDREFHVSFRLPPGWQALGASRWMDSGWERDKPREHATTVGLYSPHSSAVVFLYYRLFNQTQTFSPEQIDNLLMADVDDKVSQRRKRDQLKDYRPRADSYEQREIGGQRALACVADFVQGKQKMSEYLVWVRTEKSIAQFFVRVPSGQLEDVRTQVEPILQSLRLP